MNLARALLFFARKKVLEAAANEANSFAKKKYTPVGGSWVYKNLIAEMIWHGLTAAKRPPLRRALWLQSHWARQLALCSWAVKLSCCLTGILSGIPAGNLSGILSGIQSDTSASTLSGILSGLPAGILSSIPPDIFAVVLRH